ncbi:HlyD family secretion protein [Sphingomonas sp. LaA6.9]|uniref:HlyD family secretion protein n=1 Tax=Sphingomonas sp. LaA6.9 TaxID=2919914 RepID=UPI001F4F2BFE|nr:HlyD family secretion protein [Sphingomonas sp. LaA6.9]MCJ8158362.1 HlyD family secretion protein [Sphingomonas sp. LaA6.9]
MTDSELQQAEAEQKDAQASPVPEGSSADAPPASWRPPVKDRKTLLLIALLVIAAILAILYAWRLPPFAGWVEQTDNAYVRGKTTIISPQVSGYVIEVPVQDFQQVKAGQMLVRIEDRVYGARVDQARANVLTQDANLENSIQAQRSREANEAAQDAAIGSAQAQLLRAQADMRRVDALVEDGSVSLRERDQTLAVLRQAEAQLHQARAAREIARQDVRSVTVGRGGLSAAVEVAKAQVRLAEIDLDHTVIRAPEAGQLSEIGVRNGQFVTAGTQLMFLVPRQLWVIANFKEAQTRNMRIGQRATFRVDALGGEKLTGHVENMAPAAGSEFSVLRPDNATGNFVKVAQRIAVRIRIDPGQKLADRLRPGMSVTARIDTRGGQ